MSDESRSLFTLIGELPEVISRLVTAEVERLKVEIGFKAKNVGVGVGLVAGAAVIALFLVGTLIATGILALALVMPAWAAALIVSGVLLAAIATLVGLGLRAFRRAGEDIELGETIRRDIDAVKGVGPYDQR
ncbi:MAG TPA: phage holin family protein [Microbacteriaceae bacterium]|nr:phage holin family protein [Microbacteriaceae bacterium]